MRTLHFLLIGCMFLMDIKVVGQFQNSQNRINTDDQNTNGIPTNITLLNAANFDFSSKLTGSYLGKLNIFAPNIDGGPFGFNAGILRLKFNYKDTSNSIYTIENRLINPLDSIKHGMPFIREYNKFTTTKSNTVWSFYIQPMFRIYKWPKFGETLNENPLNGIYFHLHAELVVNKVNITTTIQNIQRDSLKIDTTLRSLSYLAYRPDQLIYDRSYLNGFFGMGVTFDITPFKNGNSRFFFQPTIGWTSTYAGWVSQDISSTVVTVIPTRSGTSAKDENANSLFERKASMFYLIRCEFNQELSKDSRLIVGTDIRGLLPQFNPVYAAYIGINLNLDSLLNLITGKDE